MLYKAKSNHSLLKGKDLSLLHLTTLSNFLESEQGLTQNITKEIVLLMLSRKMRYSLVRKMSLLSTNP
jgi:hypothetical protein